MSPCLRVCVSTCPHAHTLTRAYTHTRIHEYTNIPYAIPHTIYPPSAQRSVPRLFPVLRSALSALCSLFPALCSLCFVVCSLQRCNQQQTSGRAEAGKKKLLVIKLSAKK
uniref:Uncharacterized protein n=1 Tax=Palpitomonas bilix TaxID=652834 RepID=A0A7S3GI33_9EUKA